jgi:type VI secretion system protein ImpC
VTPSIDAFIRNLVAPHVVPDPDPRRDDLVAAVESALSERLRSLLHSPAFQALESAWRGAQFLVQTLELDEDLSLHLLDLSRDQLERELAAAGDEPAAALHRLLVEEACGSPGGEPWTLVVGLYTFGREDTPLLERIGRLAAEARAVFLSGFDYGQATPTREASAEPWAALRGSPAAHRLVLALPRFLLRLPYGPETEPMDAFTFVENPLPPAPERYLWGHPALACGCLLAQAYRESGWALRPGEIAELGGLPLHAFKQDGESRMTPCAEHWLSDADAEALRGEGFTVLQSVRGRDAVRVECFQTVSGKDVPVGMG